MSRACCAKPHSSTIDDHALPGTLDDDGRLSLAQDIKAEDRWQARDLRWLVGQLEDRHTGHQARDAHIVRPALRCTDRWTAPELQEMRRLAPDRVENLP